MKIFLYIVLLPIKLFASVLSVIDLIFLGIEHYIQDSLHRRTGWTIYKLNMTVSELSKCWKFPTKEK